MDWDLRGFLSFPEECFYLYTGIYAGGVVEFANGAGAAMSAAPIAYPDRLGILQFGTGTTNAGRSLMMNNNGESPVVLGYGDWLYQACLCIPYNLSGGAQQYTVVAGFRDTTATHTVTEGAFFRYGSGATSSATDWEFVTCTGGVETVTDTGVAAGISSFDRYEIQMDADGLEARAYINDTLVATHTTNLPAGTFMAPAGIYKSAGTTERVLWLDYYRYRYTLTTPR